MRRAKQRAAVKQRLVKDNKALVTGHWDSEEDGTYSDEKLVYSQKIPYTDFPLSKFEFYQCDNVILLKSEY